MCGVLTTGPRKSHLTDLSNPYSDRVTYPLLKSLNSFPVALAVKTKLLVAWPKTPVWSRPSSLSGPHPPPYSLRSNALAKVITGPLHLLFYLCLE